MSHGQYIRMVANSPVAVLMIHGIVGSPCHFEDLIPLVPEAWSVCNILLDGHGKGVREFGATSMETWEQQVSDWMERLLSCHEQVFIVAHSMGTLFAIQSAIRYPDQVAGLFLLAVPLRPFVTARAMLASVRLALGLDCSHDRTAIAMRVDSSVTLERGLLGYLSWVPRFVELLRQIRLTRQLLPLLAVPCQALQSCKDELVSVRTCRDLAANVCIKIIGMPNSGHFGYEGEDRERLLRIFRETMERLGQNGNRQDGI